MKVCDLILAAREWLPRLCVGEWVIREIDANRANITINGVRVEAKNVDDGLQVSAVGMPPLLVVDEPPEQVFTTLHSITNIMNIMGQTSPLESEE